VELSCFVEIPQGSRNKYEYDEERGVIKLDRHLFSSVVFPTDYGFLEQTLTEDGQHLDALVLVNEPTFPGCRIAVRPLGIFRMRDEAGIDDKVLCVPLHDPEWLDVHELDDLSPRIRDEIAHFFAVLQRTRTRPRDRDRRVGRSFRSRARDRAGASSLRRTPRHSR